MKVLQINSVCGIKSTGRICTDLADILALNGHDCKIAYGRETVPKKYQKYAVRIGTDLDVNLHGLKARLFDAAGWGSKKATKRFIKWVHEYDPDIIHLHNIHGYYINIEVLFNYLALVNKPIVWTMHDCWAITGHCPCFTMVKCERWKTGCYACPQIRKYPSSYLLDRSKKNWELKKILFTSVKNMTIITPSNWLADIIKKSYLNKYPIKVIHNGIDTDIFKPTPSNFREKYSLQNKKIILGVASVWDERKGLNDFIKLGEMLSEDCRIVLVGLSKKQIRALPENIIGIPRTNNVTELAQIYTAANVFVNPTYEDNYPTTNLEAIACDTPVITYKTGGSPEMIGSRCGIVIEKNSAMELLHAINIIFNRELFQEGCLNKSPLLNRIICYNEYIKLYGN